jgi:hypothetical protein
MESLLHGECGVQHSLRMILTRERRTKQREDAIPG